jgi:uncharacterized protein YegL
MPILNDTLKSHHIAGSTYGFSGTRLDLLQASEFTLVGITADNSGSVGPFVDAIEACVGEVLRACQRAPRADNLMLRVTRFNHRLDEIHGFKPLTEVKPDDYRGTMTATGTTALYDAARNAISAVVRYGERLTQADFEANGIVFVITDGQDCASKETAADVRRALVDAVQGEHLESMVSVLVGVNVGDAQVKQVLEAFAKDAGFTEFIDIGNASDTTLARLADFVSRSISLQSRSLGSGAAASLSF